MLIALEASAHELAGIDAAAKLAARIEAELAALLVEDENLRRLAALPIARVHGALAPAGQPIDVDAMDRALRAFSDRAQRATARSAAEAGVRWSFRVVRGRLPAEVLAAAAPADLVVVCGGESALAVVAGAPCGVLVLGAAARPTTSTLVVYGASRAADRALVAAARLAAPPGLTVLLAPGDAPEVAERREQAGILLRQLGREAQFQPLESADADRLLALAGRRSSMLILDPEGMASGELAPLVERATFPLLLIR
jgi:hypothetical protein